MSQPDPAPVAPTTREIDVTVAWQSLLTEARVRPWLVRLALRQGAALLERFVQTYQELLSLSRQRRRALLRQAGLGLAGAALLLALGGAPAFAADISVDGTNCTLIEAIQNANDTTTGDLSNGCAAGDPSGADTITLEGGVTLFSAYNSSENGLPTVTSEITIEGAGFTINRSSAAVDQFRFFQVDSSGDLIINNTTLSGGYAGNGGAIYNYGGKLTVTNSTLSNNTSISRGGAIANSHYATLNVNNSTISGNSVNSGTGGGIYNYHYSTATLTDSTISDNHAYGSGSTGKGGGIDNYNNSTLTVTNSTISGNTAGTSGGGINNRYYSNTTVSSSTITGNHATTGWGGGIYSDDNADVTVSNSTISNNTSVRSGGGISIQGGTTTVTNSTISGNSTTATANEGGGGLYNISTLYLYSSTITGNQSAAYAGGILNKNNLTLKGSLISGNTATNVPAELYNNYATVTSSNNLFGHSGETSSVAYLSAAATNTETVK